ncbi:MAG: hypothetical protein C0615_09490 [Desulfuromonas sp.]|nr:MAG: hypothetical protein C0615_09490 [Desulfuromonas sp.]
MISARKLIILTIFCTLVSQPATGDWLTQPSIGGHVKTFNTYYDEPPGTPFESGFYSANSQRLELKGKLADPVELEIAVDNLLLYSDQPTQVQLPRTSPNVRFDLDHDWQRGHEWSDRVVIDRLALHGRHDSFDWAIGRQAIGLGRIVIFSPLDVVAPFAPDALDTDVRPGVDAARAVRYFGLGGQVGGSVVFGETTENNSYLLTLSDNRAGIDILGIAGSLRDRELVGGGLAGNLGPLGVKGEISHYHGKDTELPGGDLHDEFSIGGIEFWYRFDNNVVLIAQYLYNGAGADKPEDYPLAATSAAVREGLTFLLGKHYLLLGPSWEFHPLATFSGLVIGNLDDDSLLLRPQLQFSLGDNLSLDLFYSVNLGKEPRQIFPGVSVPRSEFGSAGDNGGLLLRWYF